MGKDPHLERMYGLRERYLSTIDTVMEFLRKGDNTLATLICNGEFLPQAGRFDAAGELDYFSATSASLTVRNFSARSTCKT